jgi:5-methylthioadenosine/S-adenosylhomocysteine deaminase
MPKRRKASQASQHRLQKRMAACAAVFSLSLLLAATLGGCKTVPAERVDLLVTNGIVVTMDAGRRVIGAGAVAIRGDAIVAVGSSSELEGKYSPSRRLDARGGFILPGLINGHTHAAMTLLRGLADDRALQDWLEHYIFPAEARNVNEEFVLWGTRLAALEMIRGGTTTFADMYYFEEQVARATKQAGMRGVLGETIIGFPAPDNKTVAGALAYTEKFLQRWQGDPQIRPAVAPHAIYTNSEETLREAAALARRYHAPILIHLAETQRELEETRSRHRLSPVGYLDKLGVLGPNVIAAHCIWVDGADIALLRDRGVGCVHNPSSNMKLASGTAPIIEMLEAGLAVGLGTDGPAGSNNDLNLFEEMDLAAKLQKVTRLDPQALSARQALEMATIGGARALHWERDIGSLEPGKKADLILVRTDRPHAVPMFDVYSQIVYALKASDVETVVIGGRVVMENGRVLTLNESQIITRARQLAAQVRESVPAPH